MYEYSDDEQSKREFYYHDSNNNKNNDIENDNSMPLYTVRKVCCLKSHIINLLLTSTALSLRENIKSRSVKIVSRKLIFHIYILGYSHMSYLMAATWHS